MSPYLFFYFFEAMTSLAIKNIFQRIHEGADDFMKAKLIAVTKLLGKPTDLQFVKFFLLTSVGKEEVIDTVNPFHPDNISKTSEGKIFILVHGWTQNRTSCPWFKPLTEVLLKKYPDAQVVQVDWGKLAKNKYTFAAFVCEGIGQYIAIFIDKLVKKRQIPLENITIIGHSLGGQIAGWAGRKYLHRAKKKLPRIIALDPAAPIFMSRPTTRKINEEDAEVVIVIHSDMLRYGFSGKRGTIDFYPNGGFDQPGCEKENTTEIEQNAEEWCSHQRAHDFFIEALKRPQDFMATECDSFENYQKHKCDKNQIVSLGDWQTKSTGSFYIETTGEPPFFKINTGSENRTKSVNKKVKKDEQLDPEPSRV